MQLRNSKLSNTAYFIAIAFAAWKLLLMISAVQADRFIAYAPSFPYSAELLATTNMPRSIYSWGNFDGVHYLTIIQKGYLGTGLIQAFFPVFPLLAKFISQIGVHPLTAGLIISNICFLLLLFIIAKLFALDHKQSIVRLSILVLLVFPTSFFFGAMYSESLFLLLVVSSFYFARKKRWLLASAIALAASATRIVGVALIPALIIELYLQERIVLSHKKEKNINIHSILTQFWETMLANKREVLLIFGSAAGLLSYMLYLLKTFSNPLLFLAVQSEFGGGRSESIVLFPQVVWRYIRILLTTPIDLHYFASLQELFISALVLCVLIGMAKKIRTSYLVFSLLAYIIPTLSGTFSSMPRYVLVCFSFFIALSTLLSTHPKLKIFYLVFSLALLIINTILFVQGYWVA